MRLPPDHTRRVELNDEVHARPSEPLLAPARVSYLVLVNVPPDRDQIQLADLAQRYGAPAPEPDVNHFRADFGPFRLRFERHTEFSRYMFIVPGGGDDAFPAPAIASVPMEWIGALAGEILLAAHVALVRGEARGDAARADDVADADALSVRLFGGNTMVGAGVAGGAGRALTDFRIHGDGFSRILVQDRGMTPWQAGRTVMRLLEIDTYRMMALLALPMARALGPELNAWEQQLAELSKRLVSASEADEPALLDGLTQLAAAIESRGADNRFRFTAAAAYYELVERRIRELREDRLTGLQTFSEFMERRLAPAMNTCRAVSLRQEALAQRVAQVTQLLSTRVDLTLEEKNQGVLQSMNRRAQLQLRLQGTVENLSVAALTYYVVGLVGYAAKGAKSAHWEVDPEVAMALSIPIVGTIAWLGIRRIRRLVERTPGD